MRIPLEWVRDYAPIPDVPVEEISDALVRAGLEVEEVHIGGGDVRGPIVVGRVREITELTEYKKPIRYCVVEVGEAHGDVAMPGRRGIICGASNFVVDDLVVVALPGSVLPGNFVIAARPTYGHTSDGMICSERELGLGDDHAGIIVLPASSAAPGDDAAAVLGFGDVVIEVTVTPDIGYCLSMRGIARELATAFDVPFADPGLELAALPEPAGAAYPCRVEDTHAAPLYTLHAITGFNPGAPTPPWMRRRLAAAGSRSISLAVDVTNYVMLETGQPLHAFDTDDVDGPITVRRAVAGETFETLDHVSRTLDLTDVLIADDSGAIGLAGVIGGLRSEIGPGTSRIAIEAAWFDPTTISRSARRHKISTDASRRFERGVDRVLAPYAGARATELLLRLGGGTYDGLIGIEAPYLSSVIELDAELPARVGGLSIEHAEVISRLEAVGAKVKVGEPLAVTPPTWRPDLTDPADLVEEVLRLGGYDVIEARIRTAPAGLGLTVEQRMRRRISHSVAADGGVEVLSYPFVGPADFDALGLTARDRRRETLLLANPISDEAPGMRTTLLPGLLSAARRNIGRGFTDLYLYEIGPVFLLRDGQPPTGHPDPPMLAVDGSAAAHALATLDALLPDQPLRLGAAFVGSRSPRGPWGPEVSATWTDAVELARLVARSVGAVVRGEADRGAPMPFHPGRTAVLYVDGTVIGHAGELHPRVVTAYGLPPRASALEIDLAPIIAAATPPIDPAPLSTYPVAKIDIALVVPDNVSGAEVEQKIIAGAGDLLESVHCFDVYAGDQVSAGAVSLAFALRLRAPDRTLTETEVAGARDAAIAAAAALGATLRT